MIQKFLQTTDNFLCNRVKNIFENTEKTYNKQKSQIDISKELQKLQNNPLECMIGNHSKFETTVKVKIKMILGLLFVAIPLLVFNLFTYITNIPSTYAFILTFVVAILAASRIETIVSQYVQTRTLQALK